METLSLILAFLRTNFFCNPRQSIISLCVFFGAIYFKKMLSYDGSKPLVSVKYVACTLICYSVLMLVY